MDLPRIILLINCKTDLVNFDYKIFFVSFRQLNPNYSLNVSKRKKKELQILYILYIYIIGKNQDKELNVKREISEDYT